MNASDQIGRRVSGDSRKAQPLLIREYTLNFIRILDLIQGVFPNSGILGFLGLCEKCGKCMKLEGMILVTSIPVKTEKPDRVQAIGGLLFDYGRGVVRRKGRDLPHLLRVYRVSLIFRGKGQQVDTALDGRPVEALAKPSIQR